MLNYRHVYIGMFVLFESHDTPISYIRIIGDLEMIENETNQNNSVNTLGDFNKPQSRTRQFLCFH